MPLSRLNHVALLLALLAVPAPALHAESFRSIPLRIEPPQEIRALTLRAGGEAYSCVVRDGAVLVPADLPLPWAVGLVRFEPSQYTQRDLERNAPLVLRELGELRVRLRPVPPKTEAVKAYVLRNGEPAATEAVLTAGEAGVFRTTLAAGVYATAFAGNARATRIRSGIVINPGQATELLDLSFEPTASVSLRVVDAKSRRPVSGAEIRWSPPDALNADVAGLLFRRAWSSTTDRAGRVSFPSIGPAPLPARWSVQAPGYAAMVTPRTVLADARPVVLPDIAVRPESTLIVDVQLPRRADDFAGATLVLAEPEGDDSLRYRPTLRQPLREGANKLRLTRFGKMRIAVEAKGGRKLFFQDFDLDASDRRVAIAPAPVEITGRVERSDKPVEGVLVTAADRHDAHTILAQAKSGTDGRYGLALYQTGEVLLYTNSPDSQPVLKHLTLGGESELRVDFVLPTAGATIVVVDAESRAPVRAQVQGRLSYAGGSSRGVSAETDERGRATFAGTPVGQATLFVRAEGYRGRELTADFRTDAREVTVELTKGAPISGRVLDRSGVPIAGARLLGGYRAPLAIQGHFDATTDGAGSFRFTDAPQPGTVFYVIARGYALAVTLLRENAQNEIRLSPPNGGAVTLVAAHAPPKTLSIFLAAPLGGEIIPYGVFNELGALNGLSPFQLLSSGTDGTLILPEFLPPGSYTLYAVRSTGKPNAEQFDRISDLTVPAPAGSIIAMPQ